VVLAHLPPAMTSSRRSVVLLAAGAAAGIALAASGLVAGARARGTALPADVVAQVNGQPIAAADYERVLAGLAGDRRAGELAPEDRQRVLDRLIDETLLVQRGLELGLPWRDGKVRKNLTTAVIDAVMAGEGTGEPSEPELATFYAAHRDFFARPGRLRVGQVWCRASGPGEAPAALERARRAQARLLAGEPLAVVRAGLGDPEPSPLPDALLPPAKLLDYLGPTALRVALALAPGMPSEPVRSGTGYHVLEVIARQGDVVPPLADIRDEVAGELRRRSGEAALRRYLDGLRQRARIVVRPPAS
jgi:hypothetical protein